MNRAWRCAAFHFTACAIVGFASVLSAQPASTLPSGLPRWTLSAQPVVRIGSEADTNALFERIVGLTRMPSGEIAVLNAGTSELRIFAPNGRFLRSLSRRGQGPGELENASTLFRGGDTLYAVEFAPNAIRMSTYTLADGFLKRSAVRASNAPRGVSLRGRMSTGEFVVSRGTFKVIEPVANVMTRDTSTFGIVRVAEPPAAVTWLGDFLDNTFLGYPSPSMRGGVGFGQFVLGPLLEVGASSDRAWIGDTGTGAISIFDVAGQRVAQVQIPVRARGFNDAALARARQRALEEATSPILKERWENIYDRKWRPRTAPLFTRFIPAPGGQMAVELFEEEDRAVARSVLVLDRDGKAVAGFVVPANVMIRELGADYVLGVHVDADGVEQVVQYRLQR